MEYKEQYNHPKWQKKRLSILNRDKFTCTECGDKETQLHVHHLKYESSKKVWEYPNKDLITLCSVCHKELHRIKNLKKESNSNLLKKCEIKDIVEVLILTKNTISENEVLLYGSDWDILANELKKDFEDMSLIDLKRCIIFGVDFIFKNTIVINFTIIYKWIKFYIHVGMFFNNSK